MLQQNSNIVIFCHHLYSPVIRGTARDQSTLTLAAEICWNDVLHLRQHPWRIPVWDSPDRSWRHTTWLPAQAHPRHPYLWRFSSAHHKTSPLWLPPPPGPTSTPYGPTIPNGRRQHHWTTDVDLAVLQVISVQYLRTPATSSNDCPSHEHTLPPWCPA